MCTYVHFIQMNIKNIVIMSKKLKAKWKEIINIVSYCNFAILQFVLDGWRMTGWKAAGRLLVIVVVYCYANFVDIIFSFLKFPSCIVASCNSFCKKQKYAWLWVHPPTIKVPIKGEKNVKSSKKYYNRKVFLID